MPNAALQSSRGKYLKGQGLDDKCVYVTVQAADEVKGQNHLWIVLHNISCLTSVLSLPSPHLPSSSPLIGTSHPPSTPILPQPPSSLNPHPPSTPILPQPPSSLNPHPPSTPILPQPPSSLTSHPPFPPLTPQRMAPVAQVKTPAKFLEPVPKSNQR